MCHRRQSFRSVAAPFIAEFPASTSRVVQPTSQTKAVSGAQTPSAAVKKLEALYRTTERNLRSHKRQRMAARGREVLDIKSPYCAKLTAIVKEGSHHFLPLHGNRATARRQARRATQAERL
jgi:hypothetical protein